MAKKFDQAFHYTELSIVDIRGLAWNASEGSEMAYDILRSQNRRLAKIANSRLLALEKAHYDMFAYDRAFTYLQNHGKRRFSQVLPNPSDYKGIVNQMQELITFINSRSSTVAGARKALDQKLDKISEFTGTYYTPQQRYNLGRLLGTDSVSTLLREVRGNSEEVIEVLEEISATQINAQEIIRVIDRHLQGYQPWSGATDYLNYDELMDELRSLYYDDFEG